MPDAIAAFFAWPLVVGFAALPIIALGVMWNARSQAGAPKTSTAYLVLLLGGAFGLHRLFLRNVWWLLYLPLIAFLIYALIAEARTTASFSLAKDQLERVDSSLTRHNAREISATAGIEAARAQLSQAGQNSDDAVAALELEVERETARAAEARAEIAAIEEKTPVLKNNLLVATTSRRFWSDMAFKIFLVILAFMAVDACVIPSLQRKLEARS